MPTYKSGAFFQQCYSVHPNCVSLRSYRDPDQLVFFCTSCRLTHRVMVRAMTARVSLALATPEVPGANPHPEEQLARCSVAHPTAMRLREMDVVQDWLGLRCAECRRLYDLDVGGFETQQPS